jgi:hypothetical protein
MTTECSQDSLDFGTVDGRRVVGAFDGGAITSDGGALLLGATDKAIRLIERFAACFSDARAPELIEHSLETLVGQRVFGLALGYEDLNDHDLLRHDPVMATLIGKLEAHRQDCAPLAGKSTLNRLEQSLRGGVGRYHKIGHDTEAIEALFVTLFLEAHRHPPKSIVLDLDATDDPLHGHQEAASSTATTTPTATCRCTSSVAAICSPPSSGAPTSMPRTAHARRSSASSGKSAPAGPTLASCSEPTRASAATI